MFVAVDGAYRVHDVIVGGEPLDIARTYTLASHDYTLKNGGDGCNIFADNVFLLDSIMLDNQALIQYITDSLGGSVSEAYADPYGSDRIVEHNG